MFCSCSEENVEEQEVVGLDQAENVETPSIEVAEHELKSEEIDFADFYYKFSATIESKNYQMFNGFIHPNNGCYVIESPGAMPVFTSVYDVGEFISKSESKRFFDIPFVQIDHVVSFEALPKIVCEAQPYDKLGCYAEKSEELKKSEIWNYAGLSVEESLDVVALVDSLSITVVNTYNYTFYFSKNEGKWYLSFIDLRVPCSA
jgi:hypothetical protein